MVYKAPNGLVYENRKAYLNSLKAIHSKYSSFNKPQYSKRSKKKAKRMRQRVELDEVKYQKILPNNVGTASNSKNLKVVDSWDSRENRRKFQNNVIHITDEDTNIQITLIDRENKLKPKRAKNIISEDYQGDNVITEYDNKGKKVAEMHVQYNNINPINLDRTPKKLSELSTNLEKDIQNLDSSQIKAQYDVATLRNLGHTNYNLPKSAPRTSTGKPRKDEAQWYINEIKKKLAEKTKPKTKLNQPKKPNHKQTSNGKPAQNTSPEEIKYFNEAKSKANSINKKQLNEFEKNLKEIYEKINNEERRGGIVPFDNLRKKLNERGYSRFDQDSSLLALENQRKIELQIVSDVSIVKNPETILFSPRGAIKYIIWRKQPKKEIKFGDITKIKKWSKR